MRDEYIQRADDEIDLVEMLVTLWRGKWIILLIMLVFAGLGIAYAKLSPKTWTSQAEIAPANYERVSTLSSIVNQLESVVGKIDSFHRKGADGNELSYSELFFTDVMKAFRSRNYKVDFIAQHAIYQQRLEEEGVAKDSIEAREILNKLVNESINVTLADEKKNTLDIISITAHSPSVAYEMLNEYLNFVGNKIYSDAKQDIMALITSKQELLEFEVAQSESNAEIYRSVFLDKLKAAYQVADLTGVRKLISLDDNGNNDSLTNLAISSLAISSNNSSSSSTNGNNGQEASESLFMFMLGTENLSSQIKVLEDNPVNYSAQYYQDKNNLKQLESLTNFLDKTQETQLYSIVSSPNYPVKSNGPGAKIIVLVGLLLGLLLGVVVVLLMSAVNQHSKLKLKNINH